MNGLYDNLLMAYFGTKEFSEVVPPTPVSYDTPFYIEEIEGVNITVSFFKSDSGAPSVTIEKSLNGTNWTTIGTTSRTAITETVPANGKLYLRANTTGWGSGTSTWTNRIRCSGRHNFGGNIMSLLYGDNFTGLETTLPINGQYDDRHFDSLFRGNQYLVSINDLIMPATTMKKYCYHRLFQECPSLYIIPETLLPAMTLDVECYGNMFAYCTAIVNLPDKLLPATTLVPSTSLQYIETAYQSMFDHCTSLKNTPELPATVLTPNAYRYMFNECRSLNYVKCMATDISAYQALYYWLDGVSQTGTFVKKAGVNYPTGSSGIPSGWTVEEV